MYVVFHACSYLRVYVCVCVLIHLCTCVCVCKHIVYDSLSSVWPISIWVIIMPSARGSCYYVALSLCKMRVATKLLHSTDRICYHFPYLSMASTLMPTSTSSISFKTTGSASSSISHYFRRPKVVAFDQRRRRSSWWVLIRVVKERLARDARADQCKLTTGLPNNCG